MVSLAWLSREFGLVSLREAGLDAHCVILSRCFRMFAYGANGVFIALFFAQLHFSDFRIGLFMSLTLAGDVVLTTVLTLFADRFGRRKTLLLGAVMMAVSGAIFAVAENYWVLLFAAVVGIVSATGGDFGPFRAIEESMLSQITTGSARSNVLSWYVTLASLGSAFGTEFSGRVVEALTTWSGWTSVQAYHTMFSVYVLMGLVNIGLVWYISDRTELQSGDAKQTDEEEVLLSEMSREQAEAPVAQPLPASKIGQISPATRSVMFKLWPLLIVDSLADGMVGYSLTTYYMDTRFNISASTLGDITSISYFLAAASTVFAGPLANRLGLINTMVFTHLPSSAAVLLFPLAPNLATCIALFFVRTGLNNMDQAPRSAFIAAAVKPEERTAVMGITSVLRTLASTVGPGITGVLAQNGQFWVAFVTAGILRIAYDCGLWALFINMKLDTGDERRSRNDRD